MNSKYELITFHVEAFVMLNTNMMTDLTFLLPFKNFKVKISVLKCMFFNLTCESRIKSLRIYHIRDEHNYELSIDIYKT